MKQLILTIILLNLRTSASSNPDYSEKDTLMTVKEEFFLSNSNTSELSMPDLNLLLKPDRP